MSHEKTVKIDELYGMIKNKKNVSIKKMNAAIIQGYSRHTDRNVKRLFVYLKPTTTLNNR